MGRGFFLWALSCACVFSSLGFANFKNPGGMWLPPQMGASVHTDALNQLGLDYDPAKLADPLAHPLGAIVSLGGCSASFVSDQGLVITNHHCIQGALQYNSTATEDLITEGFLAADYSDEKWAGPSARVFVTTEFKDVTALVLKDIEKIPTDEGRYKAIQKRRDELKSKCQQTAKDTKCRIASFFEGAQFYQIKQLEIRDVRLVYAPHQGVGFFGGFDDNWRWPRQAGDYGFLRAYVGPDGLPADYAPNNIPYEPKHYLKLPSQPLGADDLVMVAGYPGTTDRYKTALEVEDDVNWDLPRRVTLNTGFRKVLDQVAAKSADLSNKTHSLRFILQNYEQFYEGALKGLIKHQLLDGKQKLEKDLQAWIASDPKLTAKYGDVFKKMAEKRAEYLKTRNKDQALIELIGRSARPTLSTSRGMNLLKAAYLIVRRAEEMEKPAEDRDPNYTNLALMEEDQRAYQKEFAVEIDRAGFEFFLKRVGSLPDSQRPAVYDWVLDGADLQTALERVYGDPNLSVTDLSFRLKALSASLADVKMSKDPFIRLALRLMPEYLKLEKRYANYSGAMAVLKPRYVEALLAYKGGVQAPDANSTLRVSYGTVRGYRPDPSASVYEPFTLISSMLAKVTGVPPFNAPAQLVLQAESALAGGGFGPYENAALGELSVDFLADLDITGGNSGSATLNAKGEIVGLAFDGNYEAMASDWVFMPEITRSIHVDIRYVLWIMDAVDRAHRLLAEMGTLPSFP